MPKGYNPKLNDLLSNMMQKDPTKRSSATDILDNDLFKGAKKPEAIAPKVFAAVK